MADDKIWVKTGKNGPVIRPELTGTDRRTSAIGADPVEVPNNRYYRGRIAAGDLVRVDAKPKGKE